MSAGEHGGFTEEQVADELVRAFPDDDIQLTQRGKRGADIFQRVRFRTNGDMAEAGLIIYECKDTLQWSNGSISQMKAEAKLHKTPNAILVSRCFPRNLASLAVIDEIVVVEPARAAAIAEVMRAW